MFIFLVYGCVLKDFEVNVYRFLIVFFKEIVKYEKKQGRIKVGFFGGDKYRDVLVIGLVFKKFEVYVLFFFSLLIFRKDFQNF